MKVQLSTPIIRRLEFKLQLACFPSDNLKVELSTPVIGRLELKLPPQYWALFMSAKATASMLCFSARLTSRRESSQDRVWAG
jgi:hypothetical protein